VDGGNRNSSRTYLAENQRMIVFRGEGWNVPKLISLTIVKTGDSGPGVMSYLVGVAAET